MDIYAAIKNRYSVRSYQADKEIEEDVLMRVLDAGRLAPSGNNRQSWKFVVVRKPDLKRALADAAGQPFVGEASIVLAVVSTDPQSIMHCRVPAAPVDCAIAIDHMTLAAVAEGLGTCWIGHFDQAQACEILGIPDGAIVIELLPIGYAAVKAGKKKRKSLDEIVCYDGWE
jgi:nitroreductase